jgi:hypothetical protein
MCTHVPYNVGQFSFLFIFSFLWRITRSCFQKGLKNLPNSLFDFKNNLLKRSMQGIKGFFLVEVGLKIKKHNLKFQSATWHYFKHLQSKDFFFSYRLSFTTFELFCHNYMDTKNYPILVHFFLVAIIAQANLCISISISPSF